MNKKLPPIARTLINLDLVPEHDVVRIAEQSQNIRDLVTEIYRSELISSNEMSREFSTRFGAPYLDVSSIAVDSLPLDLIDIKLVEKNLALPIYKHGKQLFVAVIDPTNKAALDEIKFYSGLEIFPIQTELSLMDALIDKINNANDTSLDDMMGDDEFDLELGDDEGDNEDEDLGFDPNSAPIVKYVNKVLVDAINQGVSDIHIEPFEKELRVRYRLDGVLKKVATQPSALAGRVAARVKILAQLDIAERRAPQDGRVKLKITKNKAFDFRVSTLPTVWGEKIVMRLLDSSAAKLNLEKLGFSDLQLDQYKHAVSRPYGMVLITGPTGSGKTVTLYSALNMLNDPAKNISTVEDPVEIQLPGISQVNINERAGLTFASALKAFLRQDPDILMLGEIRDLETAEIAIKAAQTGHMVLSTLHTNDAPATLTRLLNMGVPAFNVASAVQLIVAQRLARRLCKTCKVESKIPEKALLDAGFNKDEIPSLTIYEANHKGCSVCSGGYKGRVGIFQVMPVSENIRTVIMEGGNEQDIEKAAADENILDLRNTGIDKVREGVTSLEEIERVTNV